MVDARGRFRDGAANQSRCVSELVEGRLEDVAIDFTELGIDVFVARSFESLTNRVRSGSGGDESWMRDTSSLGLRDPDSCGEVIEDEVAELGIRLLEAADDSPEFRSPPNSSTSLLGCLCSTELDRDLGLELLLPKTVFIRLMIAEFAVFDRLPSRGRVGVNGELCSD
jgi:hypothetical protein